MKNHRFPWLRNRTTDNRKCEKARNIKEKCTIEMFSTVSKQLVAHLSSPSVNRLRFTGVRQMAGACFLSLLQGINSVAFQSGSCKSDPDCLSAPFPQSTRHKNPRQAANTAVCRGLDFVCSKCECAFEAPLTHGPAAPAHRGGHSDPHRQTPCGWR